MKRSTIAIVAILALCIGIGAAWLLKYSQPVKLNAGVWFGDQAKTLPEFELVNQDGKPLNRDDLKGKWHLIFFGYTHCPDICPSSLQTLADMVKAIDDEDVNEALRVMFVSVDPDRDTPELLKSYVEYFNPDFIGATGTEPNLQQLTRSLGIAYFLERESADQVSYEVGHSASFILLNPASQFAGLFGAPHDSNAIAQDLVNLIERY